MFPALILCRLGVERYIIYCMYWGYSNSGLQYSHISPCNFFKLSNIQPLAPVGALRCVRGNISNPLCHYAASLSRGWSLHHISNIALSPLPLLDLCAQTLGHHSEASVHLPLSGYIHPNDKHCLISGSSYRLNGHCVGMMASIWREDLLKMHCISVSISAVILYRDHIDLIFFMSAGAAGPVIMWLSLR